jgi:hypothetical protein
MHTTPAIASDFVLQLVAGYSHRSWQPADKTQLKSHHRQLIFTRQTPSRIPPPCSSIATRPETRFSACLTATRNPTIKDVAADIKQFSRLTNRRRPLISGPRQQNMRSSLINPANQMLEILRLPVHYMSGKNHPRAETFHRGSRLPANDYRHVSPY